MIVLVCALAWPGIGCMSRYRSARARERIISVIASLPPLLFARHGKSCKGNAKNELVVFVPRQVGHRVENHFNVAHPATRAQQRLATSEAQESGPQLHSSPISSPSSQTASKASPTLLAFDPRLRVTRPLHRATGGVKLGKRNTKKDRV